MNDIFQQAFLDELEKISQTVGIYSTKTPTPKPMKKRPTGRMGSFLRPSAQRAAPLPTPEKIPGVGGDYLP